MDSGCLEADGPGPALSQPIRWGGTPRPGPGKRFCPHLRMSLAIACSSLGGLAYAELSRRHPQELGEPGRRRTRHPTHPAVAHQLSPAEISGRGKADRENRRGRHLSPRPGGTKEMGGDRLDRKHLGRIGRAGRVGIEFSKRPPLLLAQARTPQQKHHRTGPQGTHSNRRQKQ